MQSIFYMRHGESAANAMHVVAGQTESPLTEKGIEQAHDAAQWAHDKGLVFDVIISSPLSRCVDTARIIARKLQYPVGKIIYDEDLKERSCGDFEGGPADAYYEVPESIAVIDHGVESPESLHDRAAHLIERLKEYPDKKILIVSHNGIGKMLRIITEGRDASEYDKTSSLPNAVMMRFI